MALGLLVGNLAEKFSMPLPNTGLYSSNTDFDIGSSSYNRRITSATPYDIPLSTIVFDMNKDQLLKNRDRFRKQFTIEVIHAIMAKYNEGHSEFRIKFNQATQMNSFKQGIGHDYLEFAMNHLQSKDFMCTIIDVENNNLFDQEYVIYL